MIQKKPYQINYRKKTGKLSPLRFYKANKAEIYFTEAKIVQAIMNSQPIYISHITHFKSVFCLIYRRTFCVGQ